MVIQKEPRSRRVEEDSDEGFIGAGELPTPVTNESESVAADSNDGNGDDSGVNIPVRAVDTVFEDMEPVDAAQAFQDVDHEDDDDYEDIALAQEEPEEETGPNVDDAL